MAIMVNETLYTLLGQQLPALIAGIFSICCIKDWHTEMGWPLMAAVLVALFLVYPVVRKVLSILGTILAGLILAMVHIYWDVKYKTGGKNKRQKYSWEDDDWEEKYEDYANYHYTHYGQGRYDDGRGWQGGESYGQERWQEEQHERTEEEKGYSFGGSSAIDEAMAAFGLKQPFTEDDLKKAYHREMKKAHPDAGGNEELAKKINEYYRVLKGYI